MFSLCHSILFKKVKSTQLTLVKPGKRGNQDGNDKLLEIKHENTAFQNLQDKAKTVLGTNLIDLNEFSRK